MVDGSSTDCGHYCTLVQANGQPMIAYQTLASTINLKIAISETDKSPDAGGDWTTYTMDTGSLTGLWRGSSNTGGNPYVVYKEAAGTGDLMAARATETTPESSTDWTITTVLDNSYDLGKDASMILGPSNRLWISYSEDRHEATRSNDRIKFTRGNSEWT